MQNNKLYLSDYTLFKAKDNGISAGGFYYDKKGDSWLIKEGHYFQPQYPVQEYLAGGLYQLILGENAPQTEIIINDYNNTFLIGSKLLPDFKTLSDYSYSDGFDSDELFLFWNNSNLESYESNSIYGENFPLSFNGKPVEGFMDAIAAIQFLGDTDAHSANVGLIDHGDSYSFAKIDHGFVFNFDYMPTDSLDDFRFELNYTYDIKDLEEIGFDEVYNSIANIARLGFSEIENVVSDKMATVKTYMQELHLKDLTLEYNQKHHGNLQWNLDVYEETLLHNLQDQQKNYQNIIDFMDLERAIIEHDSFTFCDLMDKGMSLQEPFKPFYNPVYISNWDVKTQSITGLYLVEKNWPELLADTIRMEEVLPANNESSQYQNTVLVTDYFFKDVQPELMPVLFIEQ